jgi:UDP-N-acetylglucosamine:LPS N-acetylglucosamine transferase
VSNSQKIIIACGGTGGHLFPGIAVAQELKARGHKVLLLISEKKVDAQASQKYSDLRFETVRAIAKPPTFSLKWFLFCGVCVRQSSSAAVSLIGRKQVWFLEWEGLLLFLR